MGAVATSHGEEVSSPEVALKRVARALVCAGVSVAALTVAPASQAVEGGTTEGCTPGYWKVQQHWDSWQEAEPTQLLVSKYSGAALYNSTMELTLVQALQGRGGSGVEGAAAILARAAVAAYLNAAYDDGQGHLAYPWRRGVSAFGNPPLVQTVNAAFASRNRDTMLDLAARLDKANNLGCPLN
jgi:hypothetical protein